MPRSLCLRVLNSYSLIDTNIEALFSKIKHHPKLLIIVKVIHHKNEFKTKITTVCLL